MEMKNTDLRDCKNNMIFEGEKLENITNGDEYIVKFGYYMTDNDDMVYGFYLVRTNSGFYTAHSMPRANDKGMLKLLNTSRQ